MPVMLFCALLSVSAIAETADVITARSPANRVALLELYTSQGCSSCPPAESWLSGLKASGISPRQVVPLAFHVTYWDYIGWKDRFADTRYDQRQRQIAAFNQQRTIYTPQFVLDGNDYRRYASFANDVRELISQPSVVELVISARQQKADSMEIELAANTADNSLDEVALYLAVYENDLRSQVEQGENEGRLLHHDYVVRQLYGPFRRDLSSGQTSVKQPLMIDRGWKKHNLNLVAFAQQPQDGEILQAVHLELENLR